MKAILLRGYGGTDMMEMGERTDPVIGAGELLVRVRATALNRADLLQRRGLYPPPPGASDIIGLEMAGEVAAVGEGVAHWRVGDRVMALLPGGGYAQYVAIPAGMAMRLPDGFSFELGAAIPEAFLTAYLNICWLGGMRPANGGIAADYVDGSEGSQDRRACGEDREWNVLIHAGASGVGTAAIQLVREMEGAAYVTVGSERKKQFCLELGAKAVWNYKDGSFKSWLAEKLDGRGADIILDFVGAPYFEDNVHSLAVDGKLIFLGTMGGGKADGVNLSLVLSKRLQLLGSALRTRSVADKISLTRQFGEFALPRFGDGRLRPVIDKVYDWRDAAKAHEYMESNANIGKIVLSVD